ncbi:MAG: hypothetical protein U9R19_00995 [Bacteroidota bacterium]|nr:hypothetical protein [Bacteroidota bacterium]
MKKVFVSIIILIAGFSADAGNENYPVGARQAAMANSSVMQADLWSLWHNQAGLAFLNKTTFGVHYENRFIINEYGYQAFGLAVPSKYGTVGISISYFGYKLYNEKKFGLAYSRAFGDKFSFGLQIDYLHTHIDQEYGNQGVAVFEAGVMAEVIDNLFIGAHVYNPTQSKLAIYEEERIPTVYRFGLGYSILEKAFISLEYEKDIDFETRFKAGLEYNVVKNFYLRTGIKTKPFENAFGLGYVFDNIHADIAFTNHEILGLTPHFSMLYTF